MDLPGLPLDSLVPWMLADSGRVQIVQRKVVYSGPGGTVKDLLLPLNIRRWCVLFCGNPTIDFYLALSPGGDTAVAFRINAGQNSIYFDYPTFRSWVSGPMYLGASSGGSPSVSVVEVILVR